MVGMQGALRLIYPDQCVACGGLVAGNGGLCAGCWREMPFLRGARCRYCAQPVLGEQEDDLTCDTCLANRPNWHSGKAALLYEGSARRMILGLKHGDRTDIVAPAAKWMVDAGADQVTPDTVIVPVPIHWRRLVKRRYNQAAELAREVARIGGAEFWPDALRRARHTPSLDGKTHQERHNILDGAIRARHRFAGRSVLIIDDVLTTGATLGASADACRDAGAGRISVLVLARVTRTH